LVIAPDSHFTEKASGALREFSFPHGEGNCEYLLEKWPEPQGDRRCRMCLAPGIFHGDGSEGEWRRSEGKMAVLGARLPRARVRDGDEVKPGMRRSKRRCSAGLARTRPESPWVVSDERARRNVTRERANQRRARPGRCTKRVAATSGRSGFSWHETSPCGLATCGAPPALRWPHKELRGT